MRRMHNFLNKLDDYYYDVYLPKHNTFGNRIMHLFGNIFTFIWILFAILLAPNIYCVMMLLSSPCVVYLFAIPGHLLFETGEARRPAFLNSNFLMAKLADLRMCHELMTGKLPLESPYD